MVELDTSFISLSQRGRAGVGVIIVVYPFWVTVHSPLPTSPRWGEEMNDYIF
jgi:hypothetical protein